MLNNAESARKARERHGRKLGGSKPSYTYTRVGDRFPSKSVLYPLERMYPYCMGSCIVALWICILTVSLPLYSVHWVVLYRCVSYRCIVMYRFLCLVPSFAQYSNLYQYMRLYRLSSILNDTNRYMTSLSPLPRGCFGPGETCIDTGSNRGAPSV